MSPAALEGDAEAERVSHGQDLEGLTERQERQQSLEPLAETRTMVLHQGNNSSGTGSKF